MVTCLLNYINAKHATGVFKTVKEWQTMVIDNFRVMLIVNVPPASRFFITKS